MSFRILILPHMRPLAPELTACADAVIRPDTSQETMHELAHALAYHQPMRVIVAPGQEESWPVRTLLAYWDEYAPGMHWSIEPLAALEDTHAPV